MSTNFKATSAFVSAGRFTTLLLASTSLCVAVQISGCAKTDEQQVNLEARAKKRARDVDTAARLQSAAFAFDSFAKYYGCAPGMLADVLARPTASRLKELGCGRVEPDVTNDGNFLPKTAPYSAKDMSGFEVTKRWDGLVVLTWSLDIPNGKPVTWECGILDAKNFACPTLTF